MVRFETSEVLNDIDCPSGAVDDAVHTVDPVVLKVDGEQDTDVSVGVRTLTVVFPELVP